MLDRRRGARFQPRPQRRGRCRWLGLHNARAAELVRPAGRRDRRLPLVDGLEQCAIAGSRLLVLQLHGGWRYVVFMGIGFLLDRGSHQYAPTAVEAGAVLRPGVVAAGPFVFVRDANAAEIVVEAVVIVGVVLPVAAGITAAAVAVSVVDAAVVTDLDGPVAGVPDVSALAEGPIAGRPKQILRRRSRSRSVPGSWARGWPRRTRPGSWKRGTSGAWMCSLVGSGMPSDMDTMRNGGRAGIYSA